MPKTIEQLIIENEELRSRLVEIEQTLLAIQSGDVDAIVVSGGKGEQIYSISSAETPYRAFIEGMNEGAITLSREGIIIYCNQRFAELVNEPVERVMGSYFKRFIDPNDRSKFNNLLSHQTNKENVLIVSLINSLYLKLSFRLLPSYLEGDFCILVATDISEMKRKEKKLLDLKHSLEQKIHVIQSLRMQLIDKKIDDKVELNKLKKNNKELAKEIARHKQVIAGFKQRHKKSIP